MDNVVAWRVGEFWSSANPGKKVLCLAQGDDLVEWAKRSDFIRWVEPIGSVGERRDLTDAQIDTVWDGMNGGTEWLRTFGYQQFARAVLAAANTAMANDEADLECQTPPLGWRCTRGAGHDGPCAAVECPEDTEAVTRGMERLADARDAARYRFLRAVGPKQQNIIAHYALDEMDKIVDAARGAK